MGEFWSTLPGNLRDLVLLVLLLAPLGLAFGLCCAASSGAIGG